MAKKLEISVEEFRDVLLQIANSSVLALDDLWTFADPDGSGGQIFVLDMIQDPNALDLESEATRRTELKDRLLMRSKSLPERERLVIALYYYENLTLREIREVLASPSLACRAHTKSVLALRSRPGLTSRILRRMGYRAPDRIRNVALIGHRGSGKTSLAEAIRSRRGR